MVDSNTTRRARHGSKIKGGRPRGGVCETKRRHGKSQERDGLARFPAKQFPIWEKACGHVREKVVSAIGRRRDTGKYNRKRNRLA